MKTRVGLRYFVPDCSLEKLVKTLPNGDKVFIRRIQPWTIKISKTKRTLREKCQNTEFFLVRVFQHLDWILRDTSFLIVFSPNEGKCGREKNPYLDKFHRVGVYPYENMGSFERVFETRLPDKKYSFTSLKRWSSHQ